VSVGFGGPEEEGSLEVLMELQGLELKFSWSGECFVEARSIAGYLTKFPDFVDGTGVDWADAPRLAEELLLVSSIPSAIESNGVRFKLLLFGGDLATGVERLPVLSACCCFF
jgi:hypothetical protein